MSGFPSQPSAGHASKGSTPLVSVDTQAVMPLVISGLVGADVEYEVKARRTTITAAPCSTLRRSLTALLGVFAFASSGRLDCAPGVTVETSLAVFWSTCDGTYLG